MKGVKRYDNKGYGHSPIVVNFLKDRLEFLKEEEKMKEKKIAGEEISPIEQKEFDLKRNRMKQRKYTLLNEHIFPSMSNLIVFFENLGKYPGLVNIFEDDIIELLGVNQDFSNGSSTNFSFDRLLNSILRSNVSRNVVLKLYLLKSMQYIIYQELIDLSELVLGHESLNMISQDTSRPLYWLGILLKTSSNYKYNVKDTIQRPDNF